MGQSWMKKAESRTSQRIVEYYWLRRYYANSLTARKQALDTYSKLSAQKVPPTPAEKYNVLADFYSAKGLDKLVASKVRGHSLNLPSRVTAVCTCLISSTPCFWFVVCILCDLDSRLFWAAGGIPVHDSCTSYLSS